jgi:hypothetical protein
MIADAVIGMTEALALGCLEGRHTDVEEMVDTLVLFSAAPAGRSGGRADSGEHPNGAGRSLQLPPPGMSYYRNRKAWMPGLWLSDDDRSPGAARITAPRAVPPSPPERA